MSRYLAAFRKHWDRLVRFVDGPTEPDPQTKPNWIVTRSDLDEQKPPIKPPAAVRDRVDFSVGDKRMVAGTSVLTPAEILTAAGYDATRAASPLRQTVLVVLENGTPFWVYGPTEFDTPIHVYFGRRFLAWPGDAPAIHWYSLNDRWHPSLEFALAPDNILARAGFDPDTARLCRVADGGATPLTDGRRPVRVNDCQFVTEVIDG